MRQLSRGRLWGVDLVRLFVFEGEREFIDLDAF